jgi:hypothetical protein
MESAQPVLREIPARALIFLNAPGADLQAAAGQ